MERICVQIGILCLLVGFALPIRAEEGAGTESPLTAPTGARALALGGTAVALGEGPENLAQNPARLAWMRQGSVSIYHTSLYSDQTSLNSGFVAYPTLDLGTFAAGIQRLGVGGIDGRDARNVPVGAFDVSELHASVGYGRSLEPWLSGGLALRIVQQSVGEANATGAGVDLGLAARRQLPWAGHALHVGLVAQNLVQPNLRLDEEEVSDPTRTKIGTGYAWNPPRRRLHGVLALEWAYSPEADARWGAGLELGFDHTFFLRGGVDDGELTAGIGVRVHGLDFAYATRDDADLPRDDRFTLAYRYGRSVDERLEARRNEQEEKVSSRLESLLRSKEEEALAQARSEAESAWERQELDQVEVLYRRVLLLAPSDEQARRRIDDARRLLALQSADAELASGSAARAATQYQRILDRWPNDEGAAAGLADARQLIAEHEDRRGQIRDLFSEALARFTDADLPGARAALKELLRLEPDHEGARELVGQVDSAWEKQVANLVARAEDSAAAEDYRAAISHLQRARGLAPGRGAEFETRIIHWRELLAEHQQELASAEAARPSPHARRISESQRAELQKWFTEGMQEFENGNYQRATRAWRNVWEVDPNHGDVAQYLVKAHLLLGIQAYTQGEYSQAIDQCRRALEIDPQNEKAGRYLARIEEERSSVRQIDEWRAGR